MYRFKMLLALVVYLSFSSSVIAGIPFFAPAGDVNLEGDISFQVDGDRVTISVEEIHNESFGGAGLGAGPFVLYLMATEQQYLISRITPFTVLARFDLQEWDGLPDGSDGTLQEEESFLNISGTVQYTAPADGTYYVHVALALKGGLSAGEETDFFLDVFSFEDLRTFPISQSQSANDDHGNDQQSATVISPNSQTPGSIESSGDMDWFKLDLPEDGTLQLSSTGSLDTVGVLFDAGGNEIASGDDTENDLNFSILTEVSAGEYFLSVAAFEDNTGQYSLHSFFTLADDHGDTFSTATLINQDVGLFASMDSSSDVDVFELNISSILDGGKLTLESFGDLDLVGELFDENGQLLFSDNNTGTANNFRIDTYLFNGKYFLAVRANGSQTGSYELLSNLAPRVRTPTGPLENDAALTGVFFDPFFPGQGFNFNYGDSGFTAFFYGHTEEGERLWLVTSTLEIDFEYGLWVTLQAFELPVGTFGEPDPDTLRFWGTIEINMTDCDSGTAYMEGEDGVVQLEIVRLSGVRGMSCE